MSGGTQGSTSLLFASRKGLSPAMARHSSRFRSLISCSFVALLPPMVRKPSGLGYSPFARRYSGNHYLFSFPADNKMFQFSAFAHILNVCRTYARRVSPFGYPWINGHVHLPMAFRSLSRPSSPPGAKASAHCPFLLLNFFSLVLVCYLFNVSACISTILLALTFSLLFHHVKERSLNNNFLHSGLVENRSFELPCSAYPPLSADCNIGFFYLNQQVAKQRNI